jgi:hypothetical protein
MKHAAADVNVKMNKYWPLRTGTLDGKAKEGTNKNKKVFQFIHYV